MDSDMEFELDHGDCTAQNIGFMEGEYFLIVGRNIVQEIEINFEVIVNYLLERAGITYIKPEKASSELFMSDTTDSLVQNQSDIQISQLDFMEKWEEEGKEARENFIELGKCLAKRISNYRMEKKCSNWINQSQKVANYFWIEFKKKGFRDSKSSISLFAWKSENEIEFLVAVEARDSACKQEDLDKHNKLIYKEKTDPQIYYRGEIEKEKYKVLDSPQKEIVQMLEDNKFIKIRAEIRIQGPFDNENIENIVGQMEEAFKKLEPYYNVTIGDEEMDLSVDSVISGVKGKIPETEINLNSVLYGPPGTGKTYNTLLYAVSICDKKNIEVLKSLPYSQVLDRYEELKKEGRIVFTTFHQSYGYEEFIEGIKPVISRQDDAPSSDIEYEYVSGVFKKFCETAKEVKVQTSYLKIRENPMVWNVLLQGSGQTKLKEDCFKNNYIKIGWDKADEMITEQSNGLNDMERRILLNFQDEMQEGDIVFIQRNNTSIDAIGIITGPYEYIKSDKNFPRTRKVQWIVKNINEDVLVLNKNTRLDRKSVYPLRKMDIKEVIALIEKYLPSNDILVKENVEPYVFIIDEINRGNISKIFGELITLIEATKRIGGLEPLLATLPYTEEKFGVPNNLYILGTMNTADRSIALMDTALRRRFQFIEMMPDSSVLTKLGIVDIEGINIAKMLQVINERIEYLFDREHTIGHAYFTPLAKDLSLRNLASIFLNAIIPLLQEYFYEDYSKIQLVLGDNAKEDHIYKFILDTEIKVKDVFKGNPDIDLPEKKYQIQTDAFYHAESYKQIY
ncbi:AAA family ATPase [Bacillus toyonensis]|uniref:AAA family ATPase n=1 Tax=Bacillus toyonensis TaxID=155322 RepID=UPI00211D85C9|nr:AAA family ATPase [Bacillus toyonensis]